MFDTRRILNLILPVLVIALLVACSGAPSAPAGPDANNNTPTGPERSEAEQEQAIRETIATAIQSGFADSFDMQFSEDGNVTLSWNHVAGASQYWLLASVDGKTYTPVMNFDSAGKMASQAVTTASPGFDVSAHVQESLLQQMIAELSRQRDQEAPETPSDNPLIPSH